MEPIASEIPQWVTNLSVVGAAAAAAVSAWLFKRIEQRRPETDPKPGLSIAGGAVVDSRLIERLCDQLAHNERVTRDSERAIIDLAREIARAQETMGSVRHAVEARSKAATASAAAMMEALSSAVRSMENQSRRKPDA